MSTLHSLQRLLGAAGVLALCATALPASAQQIAEQQAAEQAPHSSDAQTVARDATTGRLRAATPEEAQALAAAKARTMARIASPRTLPKTHATGARGARLTDEFLTSSVAVRQPDGTLKIEHGTADAAQQEAPAANTPVVE